MLCRDDARIMNMLLDTIHTCVNGKVKMSACIALERVIEKMNADHDGAADDVVLHEAMRVLAEACETPGAGFRDQRALETQLQSTFCFCEARTTSGGGGGGERDDLVLELRMKLKL